MQIILRQRTQFFNPANKHPETGEVIRARDNSITIAPGNHIQTVPDWIAETKHFGVLRADGTLIVVKTLDDVPTVPTDITAPTAPTSGWGAKPEGLGNGFNRP